MNIQNPIVMTDNNKKHIVTKILLFPQKIKYFVKTKYNNT